MKSNCFIESMKAKVSDFRNVKVIYLPKDWNNGKHHFLWIKGNSVFHYYDPDRTGKLFFDGSYKEQSLQTFEAFIFKRLYYKVSDLTKVARRYGFESYKLPGFTKWETYCPEFDCNNLPVKNHLADKVMVVINGKMSVEDISTLDIKKEAYVQWKYVSPYCQEYALFR